MSNKKKPVVQEVQAPPIKPVYLDKTTGAPTHNPYKADPMQQILQWMLAMQAQTNATLEKITEKLDSMAEPVNIENPATPKSEDDMVKEMNNKKIIQRKMYKVLIIKSVIPMAAIDQQMHGDQFANGWVVRWDTNKRFDSEKEANAYGNEVAPGKFKLMVVSTPVPEGWKYTTRRPNITM